MCVFVIMQILNKDNWHSLMLSSLEGDKADYRILLGEVKIWLEAFFRKRVHHDAVDDLVQDTLLAIHNKKQTFDVKREFMPWLVAVARHKWIDRIRKNLRYIEVELDADFASEIKTETSAKYDVQKLLNALPHKQAQIIEMVKLQELTNEEVAEKLGLSVSAVKVIIHRGIKTMQAKISEVADVQ